MSEMKVRSLGLDINGNEAFRAIWGKGFGKAATFIKKEDTLIFKGGDPENPKTKKAAKTICELLNPNGGLNVSFPKEKGPKFIVES